MMNLAPESGERLNFLYEQFKSARQRLEGCQLPESRQCLENATTALFLDIQNYSRRVISKLYYAEAWKFNRSAEEHARDVTQDVCLRVWRNLASDSFKQQSEFSTWLFKVVKSALTDAVRKRARLRECSLFDWKAYGDEYCGSRNGPDGAAPGSDQSESVGRHFDQYDESGKLVLPTPDAFSDSYGEESSAQTGHGRHPLMSQQFRKATETARIENLDSQPFLMRLSADDRALMLFKHWGYSAKAIAAQFGKNSRWVENRYAKILKLKKKQDQGVNTTRQKTSEIPKAA